MTDSFFQRLIASPVENLIKDELRCPKCRDPMYPPIHHCDKGHSYCKLCYKNGFDCMSCGSKCSGGRTHHLERIVTLFDYPCKYFNKGCRKICKIENLRAHEKECQTFEIMCPFGFANECSYKGNRQQTVFHCQLAHTSRTFVGKEKLRFFPSKLFIEKITNIQNFMEKNSLQGEDSEDTLYQSIYVLCLDDVIFVIVCYFNLKNIQISAHRISSPDELSDEYDFVMTIVSGNENVDNKVLEGKCENIGGDCDSLECLKKIVVINFNLLKLCQYFDVKFVKKT